MKKTGKHSGRGRPPANAEGLSRELILKKADKLLDSKGLKGFSMRTLAGALGVDAMAPYHYFSSRDALLGEMSAEHYERFSFVPGKRSSWRVNLLGLARAYLEHMEERVELLLFLTRSPAGLSGPAGSMMEHFKHALGRDAASPKLKPAALSIANDVFYDFLHGYALGLRGGAGTGARFKKELDVVLNGIAGLRSGS